MTINVYVNVTLDLSSSTKDWIMSKISDAIAKVSSSLDAAVVRVQDDVEKLTEAIDKLQAQVDAGGDPADLAALQALQAKLDAIDPTQAATLPS